MKFIELIEKLEKESKEREKNGSPIDFKNYEIDDILDLRYGIRYQKIIGEIIERKVKLHFDDSLSLEYRRFGIDEVRYLKVNINSPAMIEHYGRFEVIECSVFGRDILYKGGEGEDAGRVIGYFLGTNPF